MPAIDGAERSGLTRMRPRPRLPNVLDDPLDLLNAAARRIDVRAPQLGREQMSATEDVERQIAVTVVVAVKEAAFLMAVQRVIGRVEIEHDRARRHGMGVEEQIHEQALDRLPIVPDLVIALRRSVRSVL